MQLILCWNADVIYVYSSLLHVTGYHAAYSVLECSCYLRIFLFITYYGVPCILFCVEMLMLFTYIPLYYTLQGTMQLILCWHIDVIYVYSSLLHVTGYHAAYSVLEC